VTIAVKKKRLEERKKKALFANIADLKKSPKSKTSPRTPSPLASGMRAYLLIERNWPKSPPRARKPLKKKMKKMMMEMTMEMKMRKMRTLMPLRIDLVVFSPFLAS
jgi:hypothetical protein